jgi:hypothetical protein
LLIDSEETLLSSTSTIAFSSKYLSYCVGIITSPSSPLLSILLVGLLELEDSRLFMPPRGPQSIDSVKFFPLPFFLKAFRPTYSFFGFGLSLAFSSTGSDILSYIFLVIGGIKIKNESDL